MEAAIAAIPKNGHSKTRHVPYVYFANESLERLPAVKPGESIECPSCGESHELKGDNHGGTALLFYRCGAVSGRLVVGVKADASGKQATALAPEHGPKPDGGSAPPNAK